MSDSVNHPSHYQFANPAHEAIVVIEGWGLGFSLGSCLKYIARAGRKEGQSDVQDLKKALFYLSREIENREKAPEQKDHITFTYEVVRKPNTETPQAEATFKWKCSVTEGPEPTKPAAPEEKLPSTEKIIQGEAFLKPPRPAKPTVPDSEAATKEDISSFGLGQVDLDYREWTKTLPEDLIKATVLPSTKSLTSVNDWPEGYDHPMEINTPVRHRPKIVTLCGSTRFKDAFEQANKDETLAGTIVLSVGMFGHTEGLDMDGPIKAMLDALHFEKILLSDEIFVVNPGGYIGQSTANEIEFARQNNKVIRYLEPQLANPTAPQE